MKISKEDLLKYIHDNNLEEVRDPKYVACIAAEALGEEVDDVEYLMQHLVSDGDLPEYLLPDIYEQAENVYNKHYNEKLNDLLDKMGRRKNKNNSRGSRYSNITKSFNQEGTLDLVRSASGELLAFCRLAGDDGDKFSSIYLDTSNLAGAMQGDTILVEVNDRTRAGFRGRVVRVVKREEHVVVGKLERTNTGKPIVSPNSRIYSSVVPVEIDSCRGLEDGTLVAVRINDDGKMGRVIDIINTDNPITREVVTTAYDNGLRVIFPNNVIKAATMLPQQINASKYLKSRLDLRNEEIFTIDGEDTRDIDDAISLSILPNGNYKLGVHIADVSEYVNGGDVIDREAYARGTSVYFPDRVLPMLPKELSNGICSLNEGEDRLALSCIMEIDRSGKVVKRNIAETIIRSKKKFTYTKVQEILDGKDTTSPESKTFGATLKKMNELAHILKNMRDKRGQLEFEIPEVEIVLDDYDNIVLLKEKKRLEAHELIESFMIAANESIAEFCTESNVPFIYRVHGKPAGEKIERVLSIVDGCGIDIGDIGVDSLTPKMLQKIMTKIKEQCNEEEYEQLNTLILRSLKKAEYSENNVGHYGIASKDYCHFTSPIRRYPDLVVHRVVKDLLHNTKKDIMDKRYGKFVATAARQSSQCEKKADETERSVDDLYRAAYMERYIGEEFVGRISGITDHYVFVKLSNTCEGRIAIDCLPVDDYTYYSEIQELAGRSNSYHIGQKLKIRIEHVDIPTHQIYMDYICEVSDNKSDNDDDERGRQKND